VGREAAPCFQAETVQELPLEPPSNDPSTDPGVRPMQPVEELADRLLVIGKPSPVPHGLFPRSHASDCGDEPAVDVLASVVFVVVECSLPECGGECPEAKTGGST
jgi:hypothetical protein